MKDGCSASHQTPRTLWDLKVHYRVHKIPPFALFLSKINPFRAPLTNILKIHFDTYSYLGLDILRGLFPSGFRTTTLQAPLLFS